eukprot:SAG11_NODE_2584_length_3195_cov_2.145026_1_plen_158_part_00
MVILKTLIGSTDAGLRRQLVEFFSRRRPARRTPTSRPRPQRASVSDSTPATPVSAPAPAACPPCGRGPPLCECFPPHAGRLIATSRSPLQLPSATASRTNPTEECSTKLSRFFCEEPEGEPAVEPEPEPGPCFNHLPTRPCPGLAPALALAVAESRF